MSVREPNLQINAKEFAEISQAWSEPVAVVDAQADGKPGKIKKQTPEQLSRKLLAALRAEDVETAQAELDAGADSSAHMRGYPHSTALDFAFKCPESKELECLIGQLLEKGFYCSMSDYSTPNKAKLLSESKNPEHAHELKSRVWLQASEHTSPKMMRFLSQKWKDLGKDSPNAKDWMDRCVKQRHFDKAFDFAKEEQVFLDKESLRILVDNFNYNYGRTEQDTEYASACELVRINAKNLNQEEIQQLYGHAFFNDLSLLLLSLLKGKVKPSENWQMNMLTDSRWGGARFDKQTKSPVLLAALGRGGECLSLLKRCPPIVAAATQTGVVHPKNFVKASVSDLLDLKEMGVDVLCTDGDGNGILHYWAGTDAQNPRPGWHTLAKRLPELLEKRNHSGSNALEKQMGFLKALGADEAAKFEKSLARAESISINSLFKDKPGLLGKRKKARSI